MNLPSLPGLQLGIALAVLAAGGAGYEYTRLLQERLAGATAAASQARQDADARDAVIARLTSQVREQDAQRAQLERTRGQVDARLASYQQQLRKLIDENQAIRAWADTALPDDVVRLHASPALAGADDYAQRLRDGDALHAAGNAPAQQR
ncbi:MULTISPECIES: Rz-like lysis system protein LysB [unclassified Burkholderia]|uniref:Rz-like lysis system protein LysB n=2 Tax=Burkholderia TaxID=32008 RepID=UPI0014247544|nr:MULTISPECIES: Rz-like lysis system protein LysB [unclassified Burkholderia]NIE83942.1 LysB family phage lysis regulatory protein [Burkholderia sp. Tr-860]NIF62603.1 LysB family phage lysis regulatory protein [Burkholderia sp. Cy-647]NIF97736.1 LysB family phage lysis regulatory protein [Burkholderia sp. Ax-1720]